MRQESPFSLTHQLSVVSAQEVRLALSGEADFAVLAQLDTALGAVEVCCGRLIHIDTAQLTFIDLACFCALVEFAQRARLSGATVRIDHPTGLVRLLQRYADPDRVLSLA